MTVIALALSCAGCETLLGLSAARPLELSGLELTSGGMPVTLHQTAAPERGFDPAVHDYVATVPAGTSMVLVGAQTDDRDAQLTFDGQNFGDTMSQSAVVGAGHNAVAVVVTSAKAGVSETYTVDVQAGTINFAFGTPITSPGNCGGLALVDVTGDGLLDIVVADQGVGGIAILTGDGHGSTTTQTQTPGAQASEVVPGDFNGDGIVDFAIKTFEPPNHLGLRVMVGDGSGFTQSAVFALDIGETILVADIDHDSHSDVIVSTATGLQLFRGDTTTVLADAGSIAAPPSDLIAFARPAAGAEPEVALADVATKQIHRFTVAGTGFTELAPISFTHLQGLNYFTAGDLDGDGVDDFVLVDSNNALEEIVFGSGSDITVSPGQVFDPHVFDVDGDGDDDVVQPNNTSFGVLENDGSDALVPESLPTTSQVFSAAVGDLDGDGQADVVLCGQTAPILVALNRSK